MEIRSLLVGANADPLFLSFLELTNLIEAEVDPSGYVTNAAQMRNNLTNPAPWHREVLIAVENNTVLGTCRVLLNALSTNREKAEIGLEVHPDHRRRGIATNLLANVLALATDDGRTNIVSVNVKTPQNEEFWDALGSTYRLTERESRCRISDVDFTRMQQWVQRSSERCSGYRIESFVGPCPDHLISAVIEMRNAMADAPLEGLDWEDEDWKASEVRSLDALLELKNIEFRSMLVFDPNGRAVGFTDVEIPLDQPEVADQGETVVLAEHRNLGIGRWLKAAMILQLHAERPEVEALNTQNAVSNDPMLSINTEMGYQPNIEWGVWQQDTHVLTSAVEALLSPS